MKQFSFKSQTPASHGGLIEKVEILRSRLRLATYLDKQEIGALLEDFNALRADILLASRTERLERATTQKTVEMTGAASKRSSYDELGFEGVLGESPGLLEALEIVRKAAPTMLPILIDGESGTGKELFAKVIHANSTRADKPFVSINCGAIPENLIESELFGHKKGAFTGATSDRKGRFEAANGGTIFLDEVGELPMQGQVKLLRVLQAHEIQRVGSDEVTAVDTRVVAATNRNLAQMSEEGAFREDLFYRLGVIHASLPPLRERRDDEARLIFQALSEAYPELSGPLTNLGILNAQGRDAAQALRDFTRAVEANPRNAVAFNWLGVLHREQGAYGRAEAAYQKAIALDAGYAPAYRNLGVLYDIYLQRPQAAIEQYRQYLTLTQSEDLIVLVWIKELEAQGIATALPIAGAVP